MDIIEGKGSTEFGIGLYLAQLAAANLEALRAAGRTVTLVANSENTAKAAAAQRIAAQLEAVGLSVRLSLLSYDNYVSDLSAGNLDLYLGKVKLTGEIVFVFLFFFFFSLIK